MNLTIGKVIRELRTKRGMSQEKLAEYVGVAPQSVSKWERGEGYPDITFLIPLAEFFDVSLDVLMGRDGEKTEMTIREIVARLKQYNHLGDHEAKNQLAREAYREHPFDFRIILWYISALFDVEDIHVNKNEISKLCHYIIHACTEDEYRYEAIASLAELYSQCGEYDRAVACAKRLPDMQACREFASCCLYPEGDERDFHAMATFIENAMERMLWLGCRMAVQRTALKRDERICILEQMRTAANALYPDFDFGMCHSSMEDICLVLFRLYSEEGKPEAALGALEEAFRHGKALDDCGHGVIAHTSPLLRGHTFDMSETWDGSKCNSVWWLLERLQDSCRFAMYDGDTKYQQLLDAYRPFAVEDKTRYNHPAVLLYPREGSSNCTTPQRGGQKAKNAPSKTREIWAKTPQTGLISRVEKWVEAQASTHCAICYPVFGGYFLLFTSILAIHVRCTFMAPVGQNS